MTKITITMMIVVIAKVALTKKMKMRNLVIRRKRVKKIKNTKRVRKARSIKRIKKKKRRIKAAKDQINNDYHRYVVNFKFN